MPEEVTPDELGNSAPPAEPVNWEQRFKDTQSAYTQSQQTLKQREEAWASEEAILSRLQELRPDLFEDAEEEPPEEPQHYEQPEPQPDPRVDWLAAKEAERQYQNDLNRFVGDRELDDEGKEWVEARSRQLADKTGKQWGPEQLEQAVNDYFSFVEKVRGPQRREAPAPPQPGKAGEPKYDPRDRDARRARMAAAIEAANQG